MPNKNSNKRFTSIVLIIAVLIIGVLAGYIISTKKSDKQISGEPEKITKQCAQLNWSSLLPQITSVLTGELGSLVGQTAPVSIAEEIDLTGDGCTEAVVFSGVTGAYVSTLALMREENGNPIIAEQKESNGQVNKAFPGEGASVKNQLGYELLPQQNGFYTFTKEYDEQNNQVFLANCDVNAYVWNSTTELFEYDTNLTQSVTPIVCSN